MTTSQRVSIWFVRIGLLLLVLASLVTAWEFLAEEPPSSAFYIGLLPGPIRQLGSTTTALAFCYLLLAWLWPQLSEKSLPRYLLLLLYCGTTLTLGVLAYAAGAGMYGMQIRDPRPGTTVLVGLRWFGHTLLFLSLLDITRRAFSVQTDRAQ